MTLNPEELNALVTQTSLALQTIQDQFGREIIPEAQVRFPRGFIRTAGALRKDLPLLGTDIQRRNASYALMTSDILRWLVVRTDLSGPALSLIVKEGICILGTLCEWLTKEATRGYASNRPYKLRTQKLLDLGLISTDMKTELDWIWDIRCREHLHEVSALECYMYSRIDYNRAQKAYSNLRDNLVNSVQCGEGITSASQATRQSRATDFTH